MIFDQFWDENHTTDGIEVDLLARTEGGIVILELLLSIQHTGIAVAFRMP